jgi:DNA/RNA-binding domain of Phe-tRNA-synthetase-like protein
LRREADRTKLTAATSDALLVIETLGSHRLGQLEAALAELATLVGEHLGAQTRSVILTRGEPVAELL